MACIWYEVSDHTLRSACRLPLNSDCPSRAIVMAAPGMARPITCTPSSSPKRRGGGAEPLEVCFGDFDDRAQLFIEQYRKRVAREAGELELESSSAREGHLQHGHQKSAVGSVVVSLEQIFAVQALDRIEESP